MDTTNKNEIYTLEKQILFLQKRVVELENEVFKLLCLSKSNVSKPSSKKMELILALNELKKKSNKTIKDKDTIYTIEMILKNMK